MLIQQKNQLKEFLCDISQKFTTHAATHVDMALLCASLEVTVVRSPNVDFKRALLIKDVGGYQIKLQQKKVNKDVYTPFEEFVIAHEIGHLLLERKYSIRPHRSKEYWELEDLCDYFARMLLLPESYIRGKINDSKIEPKALLELSNQISEEAQVYWPVAAYRLAEIFADYEFFRAKNNETPSKGKHFEIDVTTLENKKERRRRFWLENEIGRKFVAMTKDGDGIFIEQSIFKRPDVVKKFPSFCKGKEGYAYRQNSREFRFIIKFGDYKSSGTKLQRF